MVLQTFLSPKFIILYVYIISAAYTQFRGKVKHKFFRQLFDHSTFMSPINAVMYLFSAVPNKPYFEREQFPELKKLRDNWEEIRDEAQKLLDLGYIKASDKYDDAGFNSFFRTGWKRFYLKWYQGFLPSAKELCPKTVELLSAIPGVHGAMFAMLSKDSQLVRHRDPYAGSIRYHLGLITPNSEKCRIYVDGVSYFWKDGEDVLFDETYIHYAKNEADMDRIILFCDIERPLTNRIATAINRWFSKYLVSGSATRNMEGDPIGFINRIFKYLYAIRLVGKRIKRFHKPTYYAINYTIYFGILYFLFRL